MFFQIAVLENPQFLPEGLQLYQKETPTEVFSCEYCEIFQNISAQLLPLLISKKACNGSVG